MPRPTSNGDNIYEGDGGGLRRGPTMSERAVTVKITDSDEEGMITLSTVNPVTGKSQ